MTQNIVREKSLAFSISITKYYLWLKEKRYYEIASQLFRSATSIGANIHESIGAQSPKDFLHKLEISLKECYETEYRLEILEKWFEENVNIYQKDIKEIKRLLIASVKTIKSK